VASFDVALAPRSRLTLTLGSRSAGRGAVGAGAHQLVIARAAGSVPVLYDQAGSYPLTSQRGWRAAGGWRHVEIRGGKATAALAVDGRSFPVSTEAGGQLSFAIDGGRAAIQALIVSAAADRGPLLFHRLAELHARLAPGTFPFGATPSDALALTPRSGWTSGFWPGALWQAAALEPTGGMFAAWALASTLHHLGRERTPTHDVGFMYGQSSLAAYRALCQPGPAPLALCSQLRRSVIAAADELIALARTNPGAGTIPTNARSPLGETIVDSMMNVPILTWASSVTKRPAYARLAAHQAAVIGSLLVRPDGSTNQAVHFNRATGRIQFIGSHQGISDSSTWSRGQGWAIYGFSVIAAELGDRSLLDVAQRLAGYVATHLPASGVPPWDYDAAAGAPVDVSAAVITAAGLFHLAATCGQMAGVCSEPARWVSLARRMLSGALAYARARPALGFLGSQVLDGRRRNCCGGGELIFGVTYALEALRLSRAAG
jgi:unsaturated chondroitin disaccharide hydrolase